MQFGAPPFTVAAEKERHGSDEGLTDCNRHRFREGEGHGGGSE